MKDDPIWLAFAETGDPLYYLLFRAAREQAGPKLADREQDTAAVL